MIRRLLLFALFAIAVQAAPIPRPAPEFVIRRPGGDLLLSQFRGKVIVLAFLFTT